ncbi:MAG: phosphodiester glycosidase family protein [Ruminococcaceae bacterium]|nr:phosphodiester glycosidase family protein [Oscillospiraceae bacterium]
MQKSSFPALRKTLKIAGRSLAAIVVTLAMILVLLLGVIYILSCGPSPTAQKLFVRSVRETSAVGFLAEIFLSEETVVAIDSETELQSTEKTDISLISIPSPTSPAQSTEQQLPSDTADSSESVEDDGIEIVDIKGQNYRGLMMIVDDPMRIFVGTPKYFGGAGLTLMEMCETYDALGGINGGGFYDPDGTGTGGIPDGLVICEGEVLYGSPGSRYSCIGFDSQGILHVGNMTPGEAMDADIQWAVSFGPVLISNGNVMDDDILASGVNPRTAIGQRADGAVLLLVVDGRQLESLGATYADLADIMSQFGAVNAANLDGGSSTLMVYEGEIINSCASVGGPRPISTSFLIKK